MPKDKGRPPKYERTMERKNIHLPPHMVEYAQEIGDSLADGVRKCIKQQMERDEYEEPVK